MDNRNWIGFLFLLKKEIKRFEKVAGQTILSPLVNAGLYLVVFGLSLSNLLKSHQGFDYLQFLIPGLVALSAFNNALQNSSSSIMISKFHGDLQDLKLIPVSPLLITLAYSIACILRGAFIGLLVLLLGELVFLLKTGAWMDITHSFGFFVFLVFGCGIFGNLGIWSGFISKTIDQINAFANFVVLPLIYLGGVFYSMDTLHPSFRFLTHFNPLVYLINGIRWSVLGVSDVAVWICVLCCSLFFILTFGLAFYSVKYGSYQRF